MPKTRLEVRLVKFRERRLVALGNECQQAAEPAVDVG